LEFPRNRLGEFARACHDAQLAACASVFDVAAARHAARYCDFLKLAAREQDHDDLYLCASELAYESGKHLLRSISDLTPAALRSVSSHITTLCALQRYPAPLGETLLHLTRAALFFRRYGAEWGHSSHTTGHLDCVVAVLLGAVVVEKHLALSASDIEAPHSLSPSEFAAMVRAVRRIERSH
jgi:sialic acid synthase SpsE